MADIKMVELICISCAHVQTSDACSPCGDGDVKWKSANGMKYLYGDKEIDFKVGTEYSGEGNLITIGNTVINTNTRIKLNNGDGTFSFVQNDLERVRNFIARCICPLTGSGTGDTEIPEMHVNVTERCSLSQSFSNVINENTFEITPPTGWEVDDTCGVSVAANNVGTGGSDTISGNTVTTEQSWGEDGNPCNIVVSYTAKQDVCKPVVVGACS